VPAAYYAKAVTAYTAAHKLNAVLAIEVSSAQCDVVSLSRVIHDNSTQLKQRKCGVGPAQLIDFTTEDSIKGVA